MFWEKQITNYLPTFKLYRSSNRSEGYTVVDTYRSDLPLNLLHKKLTFAHRWSAGRSDRGHKVMRTRGKRSVKSRQYSINYNFRDSRMSMVAGFILSPLRRKLFSLVFLASGSLSYAQTTTNHEIFRLIRFKGGFGRKRTSGLGNLITKLPVLQIFYVIHQLPKNKPICLIEAYPGRGVQYARAAGTKSVLVKMDSRVGTGLVRLPSGVRKAVSMYGLGSPGIVALPESKKILNNRAGSGRVLGRSPIVRGVAMNPVDHPHGGRTKAISHQRTPWGKTTKRK